MRRTPVSNSLSHRHGLAATPAFRAHPCAHSQPLLLVRLAAPPRLGSALNQFGLDQFIQAMSDTPEAPIPLAPEKEVELDRLCEEYAVAIAAVREKHGFGNPPDLGCVQMFLQSQK